ncbi:MAG: uridine kinase [Bacteroidota bacterium]|nr:uridine kinase [Bacteroidota bacterium]
MLIAGLTGGSGSGKTTLAQQLVAKLPEGSICVIPMDAYYKDHGHLTRKEKLLHNFDHPDSIDFDLLNLHLRSLKMNISIERPVYSYITCSRQSQTVVVSPAKIVLLDGLLALSDEHLREILDLKIFLEVSENIRKERTIRRDMEERGRTRKAVEERFYHTVQPMHDAFIEPSKQFADIVINGNSDDIESTTDTLKNFLLSYLQTALMHKQHL